jgi:hypothetical protein
MTSFLFSLKRVGQALRLAVVKSFQRIKALVSRLKAGKSTIGKPDQT